jgi:hypothetical protein
MPEIIDDTAAAIATDELMDTRRELADTLDEIAAEVTAALSSGGIRVPIFFVVPATGDSIMTFATPADPSDEQWDRVQDIVCHILTSRVGIDLCSRARPCISGGAPFGAADITAEVGFNFE